VREFMLWLRGYIASALPAREEARVIAHFRSFASCVLRGIDLISQVVTPNRLALEASGYEMLVRWGRRTADRRLEFVPEFSPSAPRPDVGFGKRLEICHGGMPKDHGGS
jgi:hypothetical protein